MRVAFLIFVGYATLGFLYSPGLYSFTALVFIAASCAPLLLASGPWEQRRVDLGPPKSLIYWSVIGTGLANVAIIARGLGRPVGDLVSIQGVAAIALQSTGDRYTYGGGNESGNPLLVALSLWLIFRVGTATDQLPKWKQILAVLPIVAYTLATTEKWPTFLAGVFFFAGMFATYPATRALGMALRYSLVLVPAGIVVGAAAAVLRGSSAGLELITAALMHYIFASYPAFGAWLIHEGGGVCCTLGGATFIGPLDAVGATVREAGVWGDVVLVRGLNTNIYTSFRYLVQDFSIIGPFVISSGLALLHASFSMLGATALARQLAVFVLFAALMSLNVTPFVHNSVALAVVLSMASGLDLSVRLPAPTLPDRPLGGGVLRTPVGSG